MISALSVPTQISTVSAVDAWRVNQGGAERVAERSVPRA